MMTLKWSITREEVADIIRKELDCSSMPSSASLAGLTEIEWMADRIMCYLVDGNILPMNKFTLDE